MVRRAGAVSHRAGPLFSSGMILLYDGECGLCDRLVQFVLRRDRAGRIRFAPQQGAFATALLERHGRDPARLDTVYLVLDPGTPRERLLQKAAAIFAVLATLGFPWSAVALLRVLPRALLDLGYDFIAKRRLRWFGGPEACSIPTAEQRARFVE